MCEYLSVRGSICACCSGTSGWHQGHRFLFSMWFHLVRRGMVFHLNTLGLVPVAALVTSLFPSLLSTTPEISEADGACNTNRETCRCTQSLGFRSLGCRYAQLRIYTSNCERFLSRACVSQCFLSFIEYLNKQNI